MHHHGAAAHNPFLRARDCVQCPDQAPACNCSTGYDCVLTVETCEACPVAKCVAQPSQASSGVSAGALAGAVVSVLIFLFLVVGGFLWWRHRSSKRRMAAASREKAIENVPGVTSPGLNATSPVNPRFSRPLDAYEKAPGPAENPFETDSIRSGAAQSAQSIPIGFASDGQLSPNATSPTGTTFNGVPIRPARSPDLNIRATPFDSAPSATLKPPRPNYAPSQRTDITTSTMDSTASSAMEALYESPTIVTGVKRTVISAGRGEVVPVTDLGSNPNTPRGSAPLRRTQPGPSPLAQSTFSRSTLAPMAEEDPFTDDGMSLRSQSTAMTNMSFGMGTPTASIRSFQPGVASRVNVASLARSATLRSLGGNSLAPSSASHQVLEHPLAEETTMYPPARRGSTDSFASNTDSVLASFPFVPPSPLPTASSRSPLSIVFAGNGNRQSTGSSMYGTEPASEHPPPLPNTHDIASLRGSMATSPQATTVTSSDTFRSQQQQRFATPGQAANALAERESNAMSGLDGFDFQFAGNDEISPTATSQPQLRSDSSTLPTTEISPVSVKPSKSQIPAANAERAESRASLDLLALSRDLAANKLAYD